MADQLGSLLQQYIVTAADALKVEIPASPMYWDSLWSICIATTAGRSAKKYIRLLCTATMLGSGDNYPMFSCPSSTNTIVNSALGCLPLGKVIKE